MAKVGARCQKCKRRLHPPEPWDGECVVCRPQDWGQPTPAFRGVRREG